MVVIGWFISIVDTASQKHIRAVSIYRSGSFVSNPTDIDRLSWFSHAFTVKECSWS